MAVIEETAVGDLGILIHQSGYVEARLSRVLYQPPIKVWNALTESERLVEWLAPGSIGAHIGGRARLDFVDSGIVIDSPVSDYQSLRVLEYSWSSPGEPHRLVRWELTPEVEQTILTLVLRIPDGEDVARSCAGWEAHLEMLAAALEGVPIKFPFERFKATREAYKARLA